MKSLAVFLGLSSFLGAVLAEAPVVNAAIKDGVVADQYIVVYKNDADLKDRHKHEDDVNKRAKSKKKQGINQVFNVTGFNVMISDPVLSVIFSLTFNRVTLSILLPKICL